MKLVVDRYIPFLVDAVQKEWPQVHIVPLDPEEINASSLSDADVVVVRTRTKVNEQLLAGSRVRLVCTATIGYDHIDSAYCESHGIRWMSCPGCNAQAVCEYIEEALEESKVESRKSKVIGIVGVGHVGSLVAQMAAHKGYNVLLNDPPKRLGVSLEEIANNCDIITFHTPLDVSTYHLCNAQFLSQCKPDALIINAARGGVVDEQALLHSGHPYILDTWENEPHINPEVLSNAFRASMHIAGYSMEGKRNASQMCLDAIAQEFRLPRIELMRPRDHEIASQLNKNNEPYWLAAITDQLKAQPQAFESLRKAYPLRGA